MAPTVDVIVLTRHARPLPPALQTALNAQQGVTLRVHQVVGTPDASDPHRWATIARARNRARRLGGSPWVMFVDDDVILKPDCVARLLHALRKATGFGALAADYLKQGGELILPRHVAMGATLFRRRALQSIQFRWEPGKCECQCCCDDLRSQGFQIGYLPTARAQHRPALRGDSAKHCPISCPPQGSSHSPPRILTALNAQHFERFRQRFLPTLEATGEQASLVVVGYGLGPVHARALARHSIVSRLVVRPPTSDSPSVVRLRDFASVLSQFPRAAPVAFWDAADVLFQSRLDGLWDAIERQPGRMLVVREPTSHPENRVVSSWSLRIPDPSLRRRVFGLLAHQPFLNGGFAAGSAEALRRYAEFGWQFLVRTNLVIHRSFDQLAMNYYCHTRPQQWAEADSGWNYCLFQRPARDYHLAPSPTNGLPRLQRRDAKPVYVVHGNGGTLDMLLHRWAVRGAG